MCCLYLDVTHLLKNSLHFYFNCSIIFKICDPISLDATGHSQNRITKCALLVSHLLKTFFQFTDKPVILKCPRSFAGEEHTFSLDMNICAADGNPRPHVQWYLQGRLLNSSELLTRRNSGEYVFTATNDHGTVDSTVKITVECKWMVYSTCKYMYYIKVSIHSFSSFASTNCCSVLGLITLKVILTVH